MVKGRGSCSPPCPPLASLSLAAAHLKPSSRPTPVFSLLKRPLFSHIKAEDQPSMSAPSPSSTSPPPDSLYDLEPWASYSSQKELCYTEANAADTTAAATRWHENKALDTPPLPDDDAPDSDKQVLMCGRQRLQQHRLQVSGKVIIPDTWGCEQQLQELVSYGIVEDALRPAGLMSARTALVSECQRRPGGKPIRMPPAISADVETMTT